MLEAIYDSTVVEKGQEWGMGELRSLADQVATKTNNYRNYIQLFPAFRLHQWSGHVKGNMETLILSDEARCFP